MTKDVSGDIRQSINLSGNVSSLKGLSGIVCQGSDIDVSGDVRQPIKVSGSISTSRGLSGIVRQGSDIKELRFIPRDSFPDQGSSTILYIATDEDAMYRWENDHYVRLSSSEVADLIDDHDVVTDKTWSSEKIDSEFGTDRAALDSIGTIEPLSNLEIQAILNS